MANQTKCADSSSILGSSARSCDVDRSQIKMKWAYLKLQSGGVISSCGQWAVRQVDRWYIPPKGIGRPGASLCRVKITSGFAVCLMSFVNCLTWLFCLLLLCTCNRLTSYVCTHIFKQMFSLHVSVLQIHIEDNINIIYIYIYHCIGNLVATLLNNHIIYYQRN